MPLSMMDIWVVGILLALTLLGIWTVYLLAGRPKHKWVSRPVYKPLVARTRDFPDDDPFIRRMPLAIKADVTDTGTFDISALPSRVPA